MRTARREVAAGWHFLLTETPTPRVICLKTFLKFQKQLDS